MSMTHHGWPLDLGEATGKGTAKGTLGAVTAAFSVYGPVAPITLDADGISLAQAVSGAGNLTITGALASGGAVTLDVPRNVSVTSSSAGDTTQTATVTGTDYLGVALVETIAFNGAATISGKKAFKTVTQIAISASMAGNASAGTGDTFGLPYRVDGRYSVLTFWNSAFVTTGTFVAAVTTSPATATTGDVRGTFLPADAADGTKQLCVWLWDANPDTNTGLYGVDQYGG